MKKYFQRLRLAQRILLIFIFCVLIPLATILGLSLSRLENELKAQSFQRLRFQTKTISMSIMERLIQLEGEMRFFLDNNLSTLRNKGELNGLWFRGGHFESVTYLGPNGPIRLFGEKHDHPIIQPGSHALAESDKPLLIHQNIPGKTPQMLIGISLSDSEWLLGQINTAYLLNKGANFNLPPNIEFSLIAPDKTVLTSTIKESSNLVRALSVDGRNHRLSAFSWQNGEEAYLASAYDLFIESFFSGDSFTLILSYPEKTILGPIRAFQTNIALTGLLILLIVIFLSLLSIRKSIGPLSQLVASAKALGNGDFSKKAALNGSPEFQELSRTFNTMVEQIERQFDELRESEERFKGSFEEASVGMALVNEKGCFLRANRALSEMLGYSQAELMSSCLNDFIQPDKTKEQTNQAGCILDFKVSNKALEKRFLHREDKIISCLLSTAPLEANYLKDTTYIVHIQDITAQKAAEIESQKLEAQLYHAQKMEAIGTLAAGIAHDFNNILSAIMGQTEIAMLKTQPETAIYKNLENALQASQRGADLIKQILSFSRSEKSEMVPIQLDTAVKEALRLLRSSIPSHISIEQEISAEPIFVHADPTQIHQLIMNLCTNSYHSMMDKDSGAIKVSLTPDLVRLPKDLKAKDYLKLQVSDTGCGIPPEVMKKIFDPYFTTKSKAQGTGLGLSIAHSIVEKHEGAIQVESELGHGTTFTIHLPIIENKLLKQKHRNHKGCNLAMKAF